MTPMKAMASFCPNAPHTQALRFPTGTFRAVKMHKLYHIILTKCITLYVQNGNVCLSNMHLAGFRARQNTMNLKGQIQMLRRNIVAMATRNALHASRGIRILAVSLAMAFPLPALAWGMEGHQVVASLAERGLNSHARSEVNRLLSSEPGQSMVSISTWADEHRSPTTARLHFVNFPRGECVYDAARECPDGQCVVAAISREAQILASHASDTDKLIALKYLVHFVGDVHQPLHAGYHDDKGGNTYQLQAFMRGSNLHAVWDSGLIKFLDMGTESLSANLYGRVPAGPWSPAQAAEESCRIVATQGFYPGRAIDGEYIKRYTPVMLGRLALAGARLADILNSIFK